ncbi:MAG: putative Threonine-phosphate decarboxylase [Frankiales bacterium]|nr:putative Threonine-phosphate decarboxylase [Frankiales bacterium]
MFVIGIGARAGVTVDELEELVVGTLGDKVDDVIGVATLDTKANETGLRMLCVRRGWNLHAHTAEELAAVDVPTPSKKAKQAVGTPSVAEAAASLHGRLTKTKTSSEVATLAVAKVP